MPITLKQLNHRLDNANQNLFKTRYYIVNHSYHEIIFKEENFYGDLPNCNLKEWDDTLEKVEGAVRCYRKAIKYENTPRKAIEAIQAHQMKEKKRFKLRNFRTDFGNDHTHNC